MKKLHWTMTIGICALALATFGTTGTVGQAQERETFTGLLAEMSGPMAGAAARLDLTVERWTTPEERKAYLSAIVEGASEKSLEGKQRKLLDLMEDARGDKRVGFARFPQTLGWDLTYAWQVLQGTTRIVRLATNRPIAFVEARNSYRTMDYPFGFIELRLNEKGEGEGVVYQAASLTLNKEGVLELESFGQGPQRLLSVRSEKRKK